MAENISDFFFSLFLFIKHNLFSSLIQRAYGTISISISMLAVFFHGRGYIYTYLEIILSSLI